MGSPQSSIFALGSRAHHHLEFELDASPDQLFAGVARVLDLVTSVAGVNVVVGFGPRTWAKASPSGPIDGLVDFQTVSGTNGFTMPATQHDLWLWLHGSGTDTTFDVARLAVRALRGVARLVSEQQSFVYRASQDLTGFEDGTENPTPDRASSIACIPHGVGAGGSVVLLQRWVHDLDAFEALQETEQEQVIGRTLHGSEELDESLQAHSAHIRRVVIRDGNSQELEVFRRSTAFGGLIEHGLMFLAFSRDQARLQRMLNRMAGLEDGVRDRLTDFSSPTASAWYFAPPIESLRLE